MQKQSPNPRVIDDDEALQVGLVEFNGMAVPTGDDVKVRGVTFTLEALQRANADIGSYEKIIGDKLKIVAELEARAKENTRDESNAPLHVPAKAQLIPTRVISVSVSQKAVVISGKVHRSKGLYGVADYLVERQDLDEALQDVNPIGRQIRLWGQPRKVYCPPQAQCLTTGSLPMFDVAQAQYLD